MLFSIYLSPSLQNTLFIDLQTVPAGKFLEQAKGIFRMILSIWMHLEASKKNMISSQLMEWSLLVVSAEVSGAIVQSLFLNS